MNLKVPHIDGSFESIGIESSGYIEKIKIIDSIFHYEKLVYIEATPEETSIENVFIDCKNIEAHLKSIYPKSKIKSIHNTESLFFNTNELLQSSAKSALRKLAKVSLLKDIISVDQSTFLFLVDISDVDSTYHLPEEFDEVLAKKYPSIKSFRIVSPFHIEKGIKDSISGDLKTMSLWILLAFSIIIFLYYKSFTAILYTVINMGFTLIPTILFISYYGYNLNLIIVLILPIVAILSLADSIHLMTGYAASQKSLSLDRVEETYKKYIVPSFLTSLTTALAFYSLALHGTKSIASLGVITGHMVMISFILCYLASPFLLKWLNPRGRIKYSILNIVNSIDKHKKPISISLIAMFAISILLLSSLTFKNNFEIFLPKNSKITEDHDIIKSHFYSQSAIDIMFQFNTDAEGKDEIIYKYANQFKGLPHVRLVKSKLRSSSIPFLFHLNILNNRRYSKNNGFTQLIHIKMDNPNHVEEVTKSIIEIIQSQSEYTYIISSPTLAFNEVNQSVSKSLISSILVSTLSLFFVFILLTRSFTKGLIGIFVNIVPLSSFVIIITVFGLHINMLTAITGIVCIGLIVDDTIHAFYRRVILNRSNFEELGYSMITTTTILFVSFISFLASDFTPTVTFGMISSIVFVVALISDLTMLPYLLSFIKSKNEK